MLAAQFGTAETVKLLLEAGALIEAKNTVSERISIWTCACVCVCVCVIFLHHSVYDKWKMLFYSILLFDYYDMEDMMITSVWVMLLLLLLFNNNYIFACVIAR